MALGKKIVLQNGIETNYHRIVSVNNITNHSIIIELASYVSAEKRNEEKIKLANNEPMDVYISSKHYSKEYVKDFNINDAYLYVKTLDDFINSDDI